MHPKESQQDTDQDATALVRGEMTTEERTLDARHFAGLLATAFAPSARREELRDLQAAMHPYNVVRDDG